MVLESTMICVDNSEFMRNGDFVPNRMQVQQDAANLVLQCKLRSNPENAVGVLAMADRVEVLSTMTQDNSKLFMKLHQMQPRGLSQFITAIRVAHLALKHRQNRNHKMRIVFFVGSPMEGVEQAELVKMAKKLKKEKVQMDVICFGESDSENSEFMTAFIETLNGKDGAGSHLVVVPPGSQLAEALLTSAVCRGEDGAAAPVAVPGSGAAGGFDFGMDPSEDPELAMALRVSLEEQRQRQEEEARRAAEQGGEGGSSEAQPGAPQPMEVAEPNFDAMTEEEQLAWALRMSLSDNAVAAAESESAQPSEQPTEEKMEVEETPASSAAPQKEEDDLGQLMSDPAALQELIASLPGVDANSDVIKDAVRDATQKKDTEAKDGKDGDEKKE